MLPWLLKLSGCLVVLAAFCFSAAADEVSYFRQHGGVAVDDALPLPAELGEEGVLQWQTALPPGNSTPCILGDSTYLTTYVEEKKQLATVALDRQTGRIRWQKSVPTSDIEPHHSVGSPATCTPACDGQRLFVFFGSYGLLCYNLDGKLQWSQKMGPFQDEFGASSSPILVDGKVILNQDHDVGSFLIALDAETGDTLWKTQREGFTRSYSTPIVWEHEGEKLIVVAGALQLTAYDPKDGSPRWFVRGLSRIVDTTPIIAGGRLFLATWTPGGDPSERISMEPYPEALKQYDKDSDGKIAKEELSEGPVLQRFFRIDLDQDGKLNNQEWDAHAKVFELAQNVALAVKPGGRGDITETHVEWIHRRGLPVVPSPLVYKGVMYMVKDGGIITSLDAGTGEMLKQGRARGRGNYYASLVAGDGKVYLAAERGVMTILGAGGEWEILASHDFKQRIMATPVIKDGKLYIRTDKALYCFAKP